MACTCISYVQIVELFAGTQKRLEYLKVMENKNSSSLCGANTGSTIPLATWVNRIASMGLVPREEYSIVQTWLAGVALDSRSISSQLRAMCLNFSLGCLVFILSINNAAADRPISSSGWRTVVNRGHTW